MLFMMTELSDENFMLEGWSCGLLCGQYCDEMLFLTVDKALVGRHV